MTYYKLHGQVLLDVRKFVHGKMNVRVMGSDELMVECRADIEDGSAERHAQKVFNFPGIQKEEVSSVLSSDGILTINVPVSVSFITI